MIKFLRPTDHSWKLILPNTSKIIKHYSRESYVLEKAVQKQKNARDPNNMGMMRTKNHQENNQVIFHT